jgi:hypothetical protein
MTGPIFGLWIGIPQRIGSGGVAMRREALSCSSGGSPQLSWSASSVSASSVSASSTVSQSWGRTTRGTGSTSSRTGSSTSSSGGGGQGQHKPSKQMMPVTLLGLILLVASASVGIHQHAFQQANGDPKMALQTLESMFQRQQQIRSSTNKPTAALLPSPPTERTMPLQPPLLNLDPVNTTSAAALLALNLPAHTVIHHVGPATTQQHASSSSPPPATLVTAYFRLRGKYTADHYEQDWMPHLLSLQDPMIIFTQPDLIAYIAP